MESAHAALWDEHREIEIKLQCTSHDAVTQMLQTLRAEDLGAVREWNEFFDTRDRELSSRRMALRVRTIAHANGHRESLITLKGAGGSGNIQNRPSLDISAQPVDVVSELFFRLGYQRTGAFEKWRHSWIVDGVRVELDRLPHYGLFIEIEGPDERQINAVQTKLRLESLPVERTSYHSMLMQYLADHPEAQGMMRFADEK
jgi:adenylate cyclase class IV